ncbi:MAG: hypothetical protein HKO65_15855 [Gemmatimonadetes bacterium]|nr:hypothetical protein [Gemmatimonadota bacterium]NNM06568.1 hypothetical protein [Gemmatimonadota bacterium]
MIALGGALGAVARYGLSGWVQTALSTTFPPDNERWKHRIEGLEAVEDPPGDE